MKQNPLPGLKHVSNSNRGKNFEAEIENANHFYRLRGIVDVVKNAEKWTPKGRLGEKETADGYLNSVGRSSAVAVTGDGWIISRRNADIDYSGGNNSCAFAFDAKECAGNFIPMDRLEAHQIHRLFEASKAGVVAGFLIKFTTETRVFFAPVLFVRKKEEIKLRQVGKRAAPGTARITLLELEEHGHEVYADRINGLWNWYEVLQTLKQEKKPK